MRTIAFRKQVDDLTEQAEELRRRAEELTTTSEEAMQASDEIARLVEEIKRSLAAGDLDGARTAFENLRRIAGELEGAMENIENLRRELGERSILAKKIGTEKALQGQETAGLGQLIEEIRKIAKANSLRKQQEEEMGSVAIVDDDDLKLAVSFMAAAAEVYKNFPPITVEMENKLKAAIEKLREILDKIEQSAVVVEIPPYPEGEVTQLPLSKQGDVSDYAIYLVRRREMDREGKLPSKEELINFVNVTLGALREEVGDLLRAVEEFRKEWESAAGVEEELNDLARIGWFANAARKIDLAIFSVGQVGERFLRELTELGKLIWEELEELKEVAREEGIEEEEKR